MPAARAGLLAAPVAVMLGAGLASPAGAAPGHPVSAARSTGGTRGPVRTGPYVLAGPEPRARPASPGTPDHTLTVKATNLAGKPAAGGAIQLFDIDSVQAPQGQRFAHGVATFRLPAGHYFGLASFGGLKDKKIPLRTVVLPQVTVTGNTTVTVRETAASSKLTMVTPRPANVLDTDVWFRRSRVSGPPIVLEGYDTSSQQLWFSPTHVKPTLGTLRFSVNQHLESPPGPGIPYEYTLSYTGPPGIIPHQHYAASAKDLATINERFYQPVTSTGGWAFNGSFPGTNANNNAEWFGFIEPAGPALKFPGRLTEYAGGTGSARMEWSGQYGAFRGLQTAGGRTALLHPGEHLTDNWSAYPLHPGVNALLTTLPNMFWLSGHNIPSAVRTGNTLQLDVDPFDDNQPGHEIGLVQPSGPAQTTGTFQVDQNGKKIASGDAVAAAKFGAFYTTATLSPKPSTIRFALNYTRTSKDFPLSTATRTVWAFRSAPVTTSAQLPAGWSCARYTYKPKGCAAQPMMTLDYAVAHLGLDGAAPAGRQAVHLTVGHLQTAKASAITKAAVAVSFDGGKTWHRAAVTGSDGNYTAAFTAPAGAKVSLRTRAADAAGGSIAETITSAYQIGS
jgi:hypothetical protein